MIRPRAALSALRSGPSATSAKELYEAGYYSSRGQLQPGGRKWNDAWGDALPSIAAASYAWLFYLLLT